jgi:putative transposase
MSYCKTKEREKARYNAVKEVLREGRKPAEVARRFGVCRSTIKRWVERFLALQETQEISWEMRSIPTQSSRPVHSPKHISLDLELMIIETRLATNRCAEVIHQELANQEIVVSLSTVRRVIKRSGLVREKSKWARYRKFSRRPIVEQPGDLVEVDTVHFYHPITKTRRYATTVIDVCSRMAYVKIYQDINQRNSLQAVLKARQRFGFAIKTIQTDNGLEFGKWFQDQVIAHGMNYRHTRVRRPNDNAHIERFNRTLREECLGNYLPERETIDSSQARTNAWLDYYNQDRLHLSLQLMTPAAFVAKVLK